MQNNWGNFSKVAFFAICEIFFAVQRGAWPKWPNGKYATGGLHVMSTLPDSLLRLWRHINHLLTYLLSYLLTYLLTFLHCAIMFTCKRPKRCQ